MAGVTWEANLQVQTSYFICATPRTGTNLLCEALTNTGVAGIPMEIFDQNTEAYCWKAWDVSTYSEYLTRAIKECTTPNGAFGTKIMWAPSFNYFLDRLRQVKGNKILARPELVSSVFPNVRYIWVTRRDKVRQAVSHLRAMQTGVWKVEKGEKPAPVRQPYFDAQVIDYLITANLMSEAAWQDYFAECGVIPFTVVYEDLPTTLKETTSKILQYLGIPAPERLLLAEPRVERQADALSEEWRQRYYQFKGELFAKQSPPPTELPAILRQA